MFKAATVKQQNMKNYTKKVKNSVHSATLKIKKLTLHLTKENINMSVQFPKIHHLKYLYLAKTVDLIPTLVPT